MSDTVHIHKQQEELLELLEQKYQELHYNKIQAFFPDTGPFSRDKYSKHIEFMNRGKDCLERALLGGNRVGKTVTGAFEFTCHLTGIYPDWWEGRKFLNPVKAWAVAINAQQSKEVQQNALLGDSDDIGSGMIPKHLIISTTRKPGAGDAIEVLKVRHISGGVSECIFRQYEQGWQTFQGTKKQVIWLDEEPTDYRIYTECLTRTMDKFNPGIIMCTFTPLHGLSKVVLSYMPGGKYPIGGSPEGSPHKYVTCVTWEDVPHLGDKQKEELLKSYSSHERAARSKGIPELGAGAIYLTPEEDIVVPRREIPSWWPKAYGMDVGWNRTAVIWGAMDPDSKVIYLYSEHYEGQSHPAIHASAIKARGDWIRGVVDPASTGSSQVDGKSLFDLYVNEGLLLDLADNSKETGILNMGQLLASGQVKVFSDLSNWLNEYRIYHRDENGKIVKENDHLMDATRYLLKSGLDVMSTPADPDDADNDSSSVTFSGGSPITGY